MKIAVTGATGYIGQRFVKMAHASGHQIVALSRSRPEFVPCDWIHYELLSENEPVLPDDTAVVVHLAANTSPQESHDSTKEVLAAVSLIKASRDVGAKFIFVSSQTARPESPTLYGNIKWQIDQQVIAANGFVVRPGQVYGGKPFGLFGKLLKTVQRLPILPAFLPAPRVQPIHVDDLASGLLRIAESADICSGVLSLASPESVTFTEFLHAISHNRLRIWRGFFPLPSIFVLAGIRLLIKGKEFQQLRSLFDLPAMETVADLRRLDLQLRPLTTGMHPAGDDSRRQLLIEGKTFLTYLLRQQPRYSLLCRYVRAIEKLRCSGGISLPKLFVLMPVLLALIDAGNRRETSWNKEFVWRLDAATVLAEATPLGARRFLGLGERHGFMPSLLGIACALTSEASWRIISLLLAPLTQIVLPRSFGESP